MQHRDCEVVGLKEIAERLGMPRGTIHMLRHRRQFGPEPIGMVSGYPAFCWEEVETWARETGRLQ